MSEESNGDGAKSPAEAALEAFVYAPIGLLFEGASLLPQLVEKGKNQVTMARMIGQMAVNQASSEAAKAASRLQDQAAGVLDFIGGSVTPVPDDAQGAAPRASEPEAAPAPTRKAAKQKVRKSTGAARAAARKVTGAVDEPTGGADDAAVDAASLAIPDYDGLSASHVVNRLAGLSAAELEAVRRYEQANRGRKTILSKVAQLQSS